MAMALLPVAHASIRLRVDPNGGCSTDGGVPVSGTVALTVAGDAPAPGAWTGVHARAGVRIRAIDVDGVPVPMEDVRVRPAWTPKDAGATGMAGHEGVVASDAAERVRKEALDELAAARAAPDVSFAWPNASASPSVVTIHFEVPSYSAAPGWRRFAGARGATAVTARHPGAAPSWAPCVLSAPCTWFVEIEHPADCAAHVAPAARLHHCATQTTSRFFVSTPTTADELFVAVGAFGDAPTFEEVSKAEHLPVRVHGAPEHVATLRGWLAVMLSALDAQVGSVRRVANEDAGAGADKAIAVQGAPDATDKGKLKAKHDDDDEGDLVVSDEPCIKQPLHVLVIPHSTMPPTCSALPPPHGMHVIVGADRFGTPACPHHLASALRELAVTVTRAFFLGFLKPARLCTDGWLLDALALTWCERTFELPWAHQGELDVRARRRRRHAVVAMRRGCRPLSYTDYEETEDKSKEEKRAAELGKLEAAYEWDVRTRGGLGLSSPVVAPEYGHVPLGDAHASRLCAAFGGEDPLGECTLDYAQHMARAALLLAKYEKGAHTAVKPHANLKPPMHALLVRLAKSFRSAKAITPAPESSLGRAVATFLPNQDAAALASVALERLTTLALVKECRAETRRYHLDGNLESMLKHLELRGMGFTRLTIGHSIDIRKKQVRVSVNSFATEPTQIAFRNATEHHGGGCVLKVRLRESDGLGADWHFYVAPENDKGVQVFGANVRGKLVLGKRLGDIKFRPETAGPPVVETAYARKRKRDAERARAAASAKAEAEKEAEAERKAAEDLGTAPSLTKTPSVTEGTVTVPKAQTTVKRMGPHGIPDELHYRQIPRSSVAVEVDPDGDWLAQLSLKQAEPSWCSSVHALIRACRASEKRAAVHTVAVGGDAGSASTSSGRSATAAATRMAAFGSLAETVHGMSLDISDMLRTGDGNGYQAVSLLMAMAADDGTGAGVHGHAGIHSQFGVGASAGADAPPRPRVETLARLRCAAYGALVTLIRGGDASANWPRTSAEASQNAVQEGGQNSTAPCVTGIVSFMRQRFNIVHLNDLHADDNVRKLPAPRPRVPMAAANLESRMVAVGLAESLVGPPESRHTPKPSCNMITSALNTYLDAPSLVPSAAGAYGDAPLDAERLSGLLLAAGRCRPKENKAWEHLCQAVEGHIRRASWLASQPTCSAFNELQVVQRYALRALCDLALAPAAAASTQTPGLKVVLKVVDNQKRRQKCVRRARDLCDSIASSDINGTALRVEAQRCWLWLSPYAEKTPLWYAPFKVAQAALTKAVFGWNKGNADDGTEATRVLRHAILSEAALFAEEHYAANAKLEDKARSMQVSSPEAEAAGDDPVASPDERQQKARRTFRLLARLVLAADAPAVQIGCDAADGPRLAMANVPSWLVEDAMTTWGTPQAALNAAWIENGEKSKQASARLESQIDALLSNQSAAHALASAEAAIRQMCYRVLRSLCCSPAFFYQDALEGKGYRIINKFKNTMDAAKSRMLKEHRRMQQQEPERKPGFPRHKRPSGIASGSTPSQRAADKAAREAKEAKKLEGQKLEGQRIKVRWFVMDEGHFAAEAERNPHEPLSRERPAAKDAVPEHPWSESMLACTVQKYRPVRDVFIVLYDDGETGEHNLLDESVHWERTDEPAPMDVPKGKKHIIKGTQITGPGLGGAGAGAGGLMRTASKRSMPKMPPEDPLTVKMRKAREVLDRVNTRKKIPPKFRNQAPEFLKKVDPWVIWHDRGLDEDEENPHYYKSIVRPMDLGTIKQCLQDDEKARKQAEASAAKMDEDGATPPDSKPPPPNVRYSTPAQVLRDVRLVFKNAKEYNAEGEAIHKAAVLFEEWVMKVWKEKFEKFGGELEEADFDEPPPGVGVLKRPKDRSKEEQEKFRMEIQKAKEKKETAFKAIEKEKAKKQHEEVRKKPIQPEAAPMDIDSAAPEPAAPKFIVKIKQPVASAAMPPQPAVQPHPIPSAAMPPQPAAQLQPVASAEMPPQPAAQPQPVASAAMPPQQPAPVPDAIPEDAVPMDVAGAAPTPAAAPKPGLKLKLKLNPGKQ